MVRVHIVHAVVVQYNCFDMREIEFRGMDIIGQWRRGLLVGEYFDGDFEKYWRCIEALEEDGDIYIYPITTGTIGQYTDLKDSEGNKIYEGDIVEEFNNGIPVLGHVVFSRGAFRLRQNNGAFPLLGDILERFDDMPVIVKGNVFDNPELLEEL